MITAKQCRALDSRNSNISKVLLEIATTTTLLGGSCSGWPVALEIWQDGRRSGVKKEGVRRRILGSRTLRTKNPEDLKN
jgi:hypothetical protein